jgi:hypothetical protein
MAAVWWVREKLVEGFGGALELHLVGVSDDPVHSFDAQAGLGREIINDRADNAVQGRELFQDESGESFREKSLSPN